MHPDEVDTDPSLVGRLVAARFPPWADLPIEPVPSAGTDNALYRLGDEMVERLPRVERAVGQVEKEQEWLPRLAPLLPLAIPLPLAKGTPAEDYPWEWSVYWWLEGESATVARIADLGQAATDLAQFVAALRRVDASDGPAPRQHNSFRGVPLPTRDGPVRTAIASVRGEIDVGAATAAWEAALRAQEWQSPPVWFHGDLDSRNLLVERGRLSAVIDFGCLGAGDPACDLMVAWTLLSAETRGVFRAALSVDDAAWTRGRGWALSWALMPCPTTWARTLSSSGMPDERSLRYSPITCQPLADPPSRALPATSFVRELKERRRFAPRRPTGLYPFRSAPSGPEAGSGSRIRGRRYDWPPVPWVIR